MSVRVFLTGHLAGREAGHEVEPPPFWPRSTSVTTTILYYNDYDNELNCHLVERVAHTRENSVFCCCHRARLAGLVNIKMRTSRRGAGPIVAQSLIMFVAHSWWKPGHHPFSHGGKKRTGFRLPRETPDGYARLLRAREKIAMKWASCMKKKSDDSWCFGGWHPDINPQERMNDCSTGGDTRHLPGIL